MISGASLAAETVWPVNIGTAARLSGVSAKMIRHYESMGLLPPVARTEGGYRQYSQADVHSLLFMKRCRDLGFSMADMGSLIQLWHNRQRASCQVQQIAQKHLDALQAKVSSLQAMQRSLQTLVNSCHADDRPQCPILDDLAREGERPFQQ